MRFVAGWLFGVVLLLIVQAIAGDDSLPPRECPEPTYIEDGPAERAIV